MTTRPPRNEQLVDGEFGSSQLPLHTTTQRTKPPRPHGSFSNETPEAGGVAFAGELLDGDDVEESEIADEGSGGGDTGPVGETSDGIDPVTFEEENFPEDLAAED